MRDFANKTALITGGASGIGRAMAATLAARGARIVIADLHAERGAAAAREIEEAGGKAIFQACDVSREDDLVALRDAAHGAFGPIDLLMNNVGILPVGTFADVPLASWERTFAVNLFSYVRCTQVFLPDLMAAGGAHLINTASAAGLFAYDPKSIAYAVSKSAVIALSENLALALAPHHIGVTCLCPGGVQTNIAEQIQPFGDPSGLGAYATRHIASRTAQEVAAMLVAAVEDNRFLLLTDESVANSLQRRAEDPQAFLANMGAFLASLAT